MKRSVAWSKTASDKLFACSQTVSRIRAKAPPPAAGMNRKHASTRSTLTVKSAPNDLCSREPVAAYREVTLAVNFLLCFPMRRMPCSKRRDQGRVLGVTEN